MGRFTEYFWQFRTLDLAHSYLRLVGYVQITPTHWHKPYTTECCDIRVRDKHAIIDYRRLTLDEVRSSAIADAQTITGRAQTHARRYSLPL